VTELHAWAYRTQLKEWEIWAIRRENRPVAQRYVCALLRAGRQLAVPMPAHPQDCC
jgi:hypothetical protein